MGVFFPSGKQENIRKTPFSFSTPQPKKSWIKLKPNYVEAQRPQCFGDNASSSASFLTVHSASSRRERKSRSSGRNCSPVDSCNRRNGTRAKKCVRNIWS